MQRRSARMLTVAVVLAVFAAGVLGGVAWQSQRQPALRIQRRVSIGEPLALDSLRLTAEQRRKADSIVAAVQPLTDSIVGVFVPRLRALTDSVDRSLRSILTPEQIRKLDSIRVMNRAPGLQRIRKQ